MDHESSLTWVGNLIFAFSLLGKYERRSIFLKSIPTIIYHQIGIVISENRHLFEIKKY